jgi:RNA polymerase subunit RPABC4/transcription elongation factor Spt4
MQICENCNEKNDDDANFCKYCGSNLKSNKFNKKTQHNCNECGYTMIGNPKFCSECGSKNK